MSTKQLKLRRKLLLDGYFREMERTIDQTVPMDIIELIKLYQTFMLMFGIGYDTGMHHIPFWPSTCINDNHTNKIIAGFFGFSESERDESPSKSHKQFKQLTELQQLCTAPKNIYRNYDSLLVIGPHDQLYAAGCNDYHRLGFKSTEKFQDILQFKISPFDSKIKLISTGSHNKRHTFILTQNDELYASGANYGGEFGNGEATHSYDTFFEFTKIDTTSFLKQEEIIKKIDCGTSWTIFLTNTGACYSCGGESRNGHNMDTNIPLLLDLKNDGVPAIDVSCGYDNTLIIDDKYRLIAFGDNEYGETNLWDHGDGVIKTPTFHKYFKDNDIKIEHICAGYSYSMVIDDDGNCYMFGENDCGQIGNGEHDDNVAVPFRVNDRFQDGKKVEFIMGCTGSQHCVLLTKSNQVVTFGDNGNHQCSSLSEEDRILKPYVLSQEKEIGISDLTVVECVMAVGEATLVFVNQ